MSSERSPRVVEATGGDALASNCGGVRSLAALPISELELNWRAHPLPSAYRNAGFGVQLVPVRSLATFLEITPAITMPIAVSILSEQRLPSG